MIPWETLGTARAPGGGELKLVRRGDELAIRVDGQDLMTSRTHGSEEELAALGLAALGTASDPRVLVGGLGMGYTLRAALDRLPLEAQVTVVELVPEVVEWNRGPLAHLAGRPLDDGRVRVVVSDVAAFLRTTTVRVDVILLDVDNGPAALTRRANQALYGDPGLAVARRALRPRGTLAMWSAAPDDAFTRRLARAGFASEVHVIPARGPGGGGGKHVVFVGRI